MSQKSSSKKRVSKKRRLDGDCKSPATAPSSPLEVPDFTADEKFMHHRTFRNFYCNMLRGINIEHLGHCESCQDNLKYTWRCETNACFRPWRFCKLINLLNTQCTTERICEDCLKLSGRDKSKFFLALLPRDKKEQDILDKLEIYMSSIKP